MSLSSGLGFACAAQATLPVGETGVCKRKSASQEPKKQRGLRGLGRNRVCLFGWKLLGVRRGAAPLSLTPRSRNLEDDGSKRWKWPHHDRQVPRYAFSGLRYGTGKH